MLVYLYFDSNKKYNAVVKIQKEKNQTGIIPKISYCKLQKITNPQILLQKSNSHKKKVSKWYLTTFIIYYLLHGTFFVFSNVVVIVSAVLNDF